MSEEVVFDADQAVTYNHEVSEPFRKYRAVEALSSTSATRLPVSGPTMTNPLQSAEKKSLATISLLSSPLPNPRFSTSNLTQSNSSTTTPVAITVPSSSSFSKCPEKPTFLASTAFHVAETSFELVKNSVEKAFTTLEDDYDWSYFKDEYLWKCKYLKGSNLRELHVSCYWDSRLEDHLLEVRRVKGDGSSANTADFFYKLKASITNSSLEDQILGHNSPKLGLSGQGQKRNVGGNVLGIPGGRGIRGPLPLPANMTSAASAPTTVCHPLPLPTLKRGGSLTSALPLPNLSSSGPSMPLLPLPKLSLSRDLSSQNSSVIAPPSGLVAEVGESQFLKGIQPISAMSKDNFYEPRLEAAKMLCDLATNHPSRLAESVACQEICMAALDTLLGDDFEDVRQFAIIALALFVDIQDNSSKNIYHPYIRKMLRLPQLVALIDNAAPQAPAYHCAQMRRKSASVFAKLLSASTDCAVRGEVKEMLVAEGGKFETKESFLAHVEQLKDSRLKTFAKEIAVVFEVTA